MLLRIIDTCADLGIQPSQAAYSYSPGSKRRQRNYFRKLRRLAKAAGVWSRHKFNNQPMKGV